ncbi:MAG TPA: T9SS type A sorting domain-containing protein [Candidatus Kapabacteria bacterium]|nr:T9SS type A sorting domain-containing protein [Candidatus Kapabacteria bacterium]
MKTARSILPFLLLSIGLFAPGRFIQAQSKPDSVYIKPEPGAQNYTWEFSYSHRSGTTAVNQIVLWFDTVQYPNVRFVYAGIVPGSTAAGQDWASGSNGGVSNNGDSAYWCNEVSYIATGVTDSWFDFQLAPLNVNIPIDDSAVVIHWFVNFASSNTCQRISNISSGEFEVIPTEWQSYPKLDTVTGTATVLADCDPMFHFTVFNRNSLLAPIDHMVFSLMNPFAGIMRPSEIIPPSGWTVDSVTELSAYFETSSNTIQPGHNLGGFNIGLRAPSTLISLPFVWSALSGSAIIERDTTALISVTPCNGSTNFSDDTLRVTNNLGCGFNFNLENSHSGDGHLTVSPIDTLVLQITTPGVTWSSATAPSEAPQFCWSYAGLNTQTLTFQTPTASCDQPSGLTWKYGASIDDTNPGELVTIQWSDYFGSVEVSSGTDTFRCVPKPTPDSIFVDALGNCGYRVRVKNAHMPTSSIHSVLFTMPASDGTIAPPFSSNFNWTSSLGNGGLKFTAGGTDLAPGTIDTFYFSTNPKQTNTPWPLTFIDYEAVTNNTITDDTLKNVPGCTPPVVMDSVTHVISSNCTDLITIFNHGVSPIDSFIVAPMGGKVESAIIAIPWKDTIQGDSAIFYSSTIEPESSRAFTVTYGEINSLPPFRVEVRTFHTSGAPSTNDTNLVCASGGVVSPQSPIAPITLSIAPNPLRDRTDITLTTGTIDRVQMVLLNVLGQTEQTVVNQMLTAGEHTYTLDASTLPAGTYYLRLEAGGQVLTKKLVIEK